MLPSRSVIQLSQSSNPRDEKVWSTYQSEYNHNYKQNGSLVNHYGNSAYLAKQPVLGNTPKQPKPFLSPSYWNLTSDSYIANKHSDNYSNNYRTSLENCLHRPLTASAVPRQTILEENFKVKVAPIAKLDPANAYKQNYFETKRVNDHFVSKRFLKTGTLSLRDTIASLLELSDYMRNKSYDVNARNLFQDDANTGLNQLDLFGQYFSALMASMEKLLMAYNNLNESSLELKKMSENFVYAQNLIQRNIWDRDLKPGSDRLTQTNLEASLNNDKLTFEQEKKRANNALAESHQLLNSISAFTNQNLENIIEEAKVIIMHKMYNKEYESTYLRDSKGYIRSDAKRPIAVDAWFKLAQETLLRSKELEEKASNKNTNTNALIDQIGKTVSSQWMSTHNAALKQMEDGLKNQSRLITAQYDTRKELDQLKSAMRDTKSKMETCQIKDEAYLTQLSTPVYKIDPFYDQYRKERSQDANRIWSAANDLRDNLKNMESHRKYLDDRRQRLDRSIKSSHDGINYDLNTVIDPRRNNVAVQPSPELVAKSVNILNY